jgi:hypothetical protein
MPQRFLKGATTFYTTTFTSVIATGRYCIAEPSIKTEKTESLKLAIARLKQRLHLPYLSEQPLVRIPAPRTILRAAAALPHCLEIAVDWPVAERTEALDETY